jgi:hypothetical protein
VIKPIIIIAQLRKKKEKEKEKNKKNKKIRNKSFSQRSSPCIGVDFSPSKSMSQPLRCLETDEGKSREKKKEKNQR